MHERPSAPPVSTFVTSLIIIATVVNLGGVPVLSASREIRKAGWLLVSVIQPNGAGLRAVVIVEGPRSSAGQSGSDGRYVVQLPPGQYAVTAQNQDVSQSRAGVRILAGATTRVTIVLPVKGRDGVPSADAHDRSQPGQRRSGARDAGPATNPSSPTGSVPATPVPSSNRAAGVSGVSGGNAGAARVAPGQTPGAESPSNSSPSPAPAVSPQPTAISTSGPTPNATPAPTSRPTPILTPQPTQTSTLQPTPAPTPQPTSASTPQPTVAATQAPVLAPRPTAAPLPSNGGNNALLYVFDWVAQYPNSDVARFQGATLQFGSPPDRVARLKALNSSITVLYYRLAWATWSWEENWSVINAHEDWFLHDTQGRRIQNGNPRDAWYLMDLSSPEYRMYIVNYIANVVRTRGFDGVFIDGPLPSLRRLSLTSRPAESVLAAWQPWYVLPFLRQLKQALGSRPLVTNSTPSFRSSAPDADDTDFLDHVDGTMIEGFAHAPWDSVDLIPDLGAWAWQQAMMQRNIERGKRVYVLSGAQGGTAAEQHRWQVFTYSSFLLRTDARNSWFLWRRPGHAFTAAAHWFPELDLDLGPPAQPPYLAQGVWQRDFSNGKVLVNVSGTTRTVDLLWQYRLPDGRRANRVTVAPWTAAILLE